MAQLAAILESSEALKSKFKSRFEPDDLPSLTRSLDQLEAQSRRLVSGRAGSSTDYGNANYLLAQAHVDAPALANNIGNLNTSTTFAPLQSLHDTDVGSYLRHVHEQTLLAAIERGRSETQKDFLHVLEERGSREWEARKKRVLEELGGRLVSSESRGSGDAYKQIRESTALNQSTSVPLSLNLRMQSKVLGYDKAITEFNRTRLRGLSSPIVHTLLKCSLSLSTDHSTEIPQLFRTLIQIIEEPPSLPPLEHAGSQMLNIPPFERKFAKVYMGDSNSREAVGLRQQIVKGSKEALESQYCDVIERTIQARRSDATLGGDPSMANRIRAFLLLKYYRGGDWEERIELVSSQPLWAKLFYLIRTGHTEEALDEALSHEGALNSREPGFVTFFRSWVQSPNAKLPRAHRDQLQTIYNTHMLSSSTADAFKLAIFRLMGKFDPSKRSIPLVTATTEDWLWFQLAMVDEEEAGGLGELAQVIMNYGERHFSGSPNYKRVGMWAHVLLMCGEFERAVAALDENPDTKVEAVHLAIALAYYGLLRVPNRAEASDYDILCLSPASPPAINLATLIRRYIRPFAKHDSNRALQYVACICLSADQGTTLIGKEQIAYAWTEVRKLIMLADQAGWDQLVGGLRPDGTRFTGFIEQIAPLLMLEDRNDYNEQVIRAAATSCESEGRVLEAIKLYNLAGAYETVVNCLSQALGDYTSQPDGGGVEWVKLENTAREIDHNYSRLNRAAGRARDGVHILLCLHDAKAAKVAGKLEVALEIIESTDVVPLDGDTAKLNRRASEFEALYHESVKRNLPTYLALTMEILLDIHEKVKSSSSFNASRKTIFDELRVKSRSLVMFAGLLRFRLLPDVYSYLARLNVEISL